MQTDDGKIGLIIQARMGSTRLPEKVLRPFWGAESILSLLIRRFMAAFPSLPLVVATSDLPQDDPVAKVAQSLGAQVTRGSESDVLARFIQAMDEHQVRQAIRICADNPFLDPELTQQLLNAAQRHRPDYLSYRVDDKPCMQTHFGVFTEYVTRKALEDNALWNLDLDERQHVTKSVYEHPERYQIEWLDFSEAMKPYADIRLTVDTPEDFRLTQQVWVELVQNNEKFDWQTVFRFLSFHPEWRSTMQAQVQGNPK